MIRPKVLGGQVATAVEHADDDDKVFIDPVEREVLAHDKAPQAGSDVIGDLPRLGLGRQQIPLLNEPGRQPHGGGIALGQIA